MKKGFKRNRGITLIALIITIIVMLILVAVSVNILIKSNLIGTAEKATNKYKTASEEESEGVITINGKTYSSIDEYMKDLNSKIELNYKIEDGFIIVTAQYKGEQPTDEEYETYMKEQLKGKKEEEKKKILLDSVNFNREMNGQQTYKDLDELFAVKSWEDFVRESGNGDVDQALINSGIYPQDWWLIITLPDGTTKVSPNPPTEPFEVRYAIKQTGAYEFKAEVFGDENSRKITIKDEKEITIVEGKVDDWDYVEEDDGTITIKKYLNTDPTIDTVIIPNYIEGKPVKKVTGAETYYSTWHIRHTSIWNEEICSKEDTNTGWAASIGFYSFENTTVHKVIISKGIEEIDGYAFILSTGLTEVELPDTIQTIGKQAFSDCTNLREISIPGNVTNMGEEAFSHCTNLTEISIPSSVTSIGNNAFTSCTSLTEITIPSSVTTMGEHVFYCIPSITVHVPWKEGEKPDGWNKDWASTAPDCTITIDYAK